MASSFNSYPQTRAGKNWSQDFGITHLGKPDDLIKGDVALTIQLVAGTNDA